MVVSLDLADTQKGCRDFHALIARHIPNLKPRQLPLQVLVQGSRLTKNYATLLLICALSVIIRGCKVLVSSAEFCFLRSLVLLGPANTGCPMSDF